MNLSVLCIFSIIYILCLLNLLLRLLILLFFKRIYSLFFFFIIVKCTLISFLLILLTLHNLISWSIFFYSIICQLLKEIKFISIFSTFSLILLGLSILLSIYSFLWNWMHFFNCEISCSWFCKMNLLFILIGFIIWNLLLWRVKIAYLLLCLFDLATLIYLACFAHWLFNLLCVILLINF